MIDLINPPNRFLWWPLNTYTDVLAPFNIMSRIFGLCALNVLGKTKSIPPFQLVMRYISLLFWFTFYFFFSWINLKVNYFDTLSTNKIANQGRRAMLFFGMAQTILGTISTYIVKSKCERFIRKIIEFDREMEKLGTKVNLRHEVFIYFIYLSVQTVFVNACIIVSAVFMDTCATNQLCIYMHLPLYIINITYMMFMSRFIVFSISVIYRFKILNKCFWRFLRIKQERLHFEFKNVSVVGFMRKSNVFDYARLHGKLTDIVSDINGCFSVQIMVASAGIFSYLVTTTFVLFRTFILGDEALISLTGSFTLWCIFYTYPLLIVLAIGSTIFESGKQTAIYIHRAINDCRDKLLRSELKYFSQQLIHHYPVVRCGLFIFDWTLMYSIVGAITTYLMILLQFDAKMSMSSNSTFLSN